MTPRELAEKILDFDGMEHKEWINAAESLLSAALDEACNLGFNVGKNSLREAKADYQKKLQDFNRRCNEACEKQVGKAVVSAYEDAAKIAGEHEDGNLGIYGADICVAVAEKIRQRAEELKSK